MRFYNLVDAMIKATNKEFQPFLRFYCRDHNTASNRAQVYTVSTLLEILQEANKAWNGLLEICRFQPFLRFYYLSMVPIRTYVTVVSTLLEILRNTVLGPMLLSVASFNPS